MRRLMVVYINGEVCHYLCPRNWSELMAWTWGRDVNFVWYWIEGRSPFQVLEHGGDSIKIEETLRKCLGEKGLVA